FFLNCHNGVIAFEELFKGTISSVTVHPRIVLQRALHHNAAAVVLAHNHPSANTTPSQADKLITERLAQVLGMVDVKVLDHLIVGGSDIYSFAEHGLI
ncbi:JAB domain-containing protein, partial [Escherichia coli]